ncbi:Rhomboid family protein [Rubripirellula lacrimiformis]|uniref:Rhomboid family protein n=1 Tax=Rubripirellula lacrimiformis TaxID=1930273 RepID=A0A517NK45_9BACT|nr:rhombosortase [Rubripirellula lacrimiformis]QDT07511.1 Rhomboid family protein [Rubripirellula lacrimiformis]
MFTHLLRTYPVTIAITVLAVLSHTSAALTGAFELDFGLVAGGQVWRLISGHWTHFDASHLCWDLLMFVVLSAMCERRCGQKSAWGYAVTIAASLLFISAAIRITCPEIATYRGLSGIDTGLFGWLVVDHSRQSWRSSNRLAAVVAATGLLALIGKLIFEAATGNTLFVDSSTFTPLVQSHLAGLAGGIAASTIHALGRQSIPPINESIKSPIAQRRPAS